MVTATIENWLVKGQQTVAVVVLVVCASTDDVTSCVFRSASVTEMSIVMRCV